MARFKGTFSVAANYEPLIAAPFDARQLVETKSDLTNPQTWVRANDDYWTYVGMMVVVSQDIDDNNNGLYILTAEDFTQPDNWRKCADERDIARLQEEIDNLEVSGEGSLDLDVDLEIDLPATGDINTTYYVKENNSIQRWDENTNAYVKFGGGGEIPDLEINLIFGGKAHE